MSTAIGSAALVLSANAQKLYDGLKQAGDKIKNWSEKTGKEAGKGLSLGSLFKGGFAAAAGVAAFGLIKSGVEAVIGKFGELKDKIDHASKASRALGLSTQTFQGLEHAAEMSGVKSDQLGEALNKLRATTAGPLDEALYDIADRFQNLDSSAARAQLLVAKFGETGLKLAPMFEGGREGLRGLVEEAQKLGFALSDEDAAKIEAANDAMTRVKRTVEGLWNKIIVALAPAIEVFSKNLQAAVQTVSPLFDALGRIITNVAGRLEPVYQKIRAGIQSVAEKLGPIFAKVETLLGKMFSYVADVFGKIWATGEAIWDKIGGKVEGILGWIEAGLDKLIRAWDTASNILLAVWDEVLSVVVDVVSEIIGWIQQAADWVAKWVGDIWDIGETFGTVESFVTNCFKAIGKAGAYVWDTIKAGVGAVAIAIGFIVEKVFTKLVDAFYEVASLAKKLPDSIRPDWVNRFVDGVGEARDAVRNAGVGMQDWGKRQIDNWGNSAKAVDAWFDRLGQRRIQDVRQQAEAMRRVADEAFLPAKYTAVGAMLKGSKEAWSVEAKFRTENMLNPQLDVQRQQLQAQREAVRELEEVRRAVGALAGGVALAIF